MLLLEKKIVYGTTFLTGFHEFGKPVKIFFAHKTFPFGFRELLASCHKNKKSVIIF